MTEERRNHSHFTKLAWWLMGSLASIVMLGGTAWVTTTTNRLTNVENGIVSIGREVSELKASQHATEELIKQMIVSLREIRDDVKFLLKGK